MFEILWNCQYQSCSIIKHFPNLLDVYPISGECASYELALHRNSSYQSLFLGLTINLAMIFIGNFCIYSSTLGMVFQIKSNDNVSEYMRSGIPFCLHMKYYEIIIITQFSQWIFECDGHWSQLTTNAYTTCTGTVQVCIYAYLSINLQL